MTSIDLVVTTMWSNHDKSSSRIIIISLNTKFCQKYHQITYQGQRLFTLFISWWPSVTVPKLPDRFFKFVFLFFVFLMKMAIFLSSFRPFHSCGWFDSFFLFNDSPTLELRLFLSKIYTTKKIQARLNSQNHQPMREEDTAQRIFQNGSWKIQENARNDCATIIYSG